MRQAIAPGGRIVVMGPNFKYAWKQYFDFADHVLPLTHVTVLEHLAAAGFEVESVSPRSSRTRSAGDFRHGRSSRASTSVPFAWHVLGKQFLVVGRAPTTPAQPRAGQSPPRRCPRELIEWCRPGPIAPSASAGGSSTGSR